AVPTPKSRSATRRSAPAPPVACCSAEHAVTAPAFRPCLVIPVYDHEHAIGATLAGLRRHGLPCFLVDDGSRASCAAVLDALAQAESAWVTLLRLHPN